MYSVVVHSDKLVITDDAGRHVELDRDNGDADHLADTLNSLYNRVVMYEATYGKQDYLHGQGAAAASRSGA